MTRQEAYKQFDIFANNAQAAFGALQVSDKRAVRLTNIFSFYALKGGTNGGIDKRLVEVGFGARLFDEVTLLKADGSGITASRKTFLTERGASMLYERTDSGSVICTLYPAMTPNLRPTEQHIFYEVIKNPAELNSKKTIQRHWNVFISYMECTNLDSSANPIDRLRIANLRFTKRLVIDSKVNKPRILTATGKIVSYALTVGLSGCLLAIVNYFMGSNDIERLRDDLRKNSQAITFTQGKLEAQTVHIAHLQEEIDRKNSASELPPSPYNNSGLRRNSGSQK